MGTQICLVRYLASATWVILILFIGSLSYANSGISYHGRIIRPDGTPISSTNTQFRIQIRTPGGENCLLWEEMQTKDMSNATGIFSLTINDTTEPTLIANTLPYTLERTFSNRTAFTGLTGCSIGSSYTPSTVADGRSLQVYFRENPADPWEQMPTTRINFVPLALNSAQLNGYNDTEFLKIDPASSYTALTATQVNTLMDVIAGTNTQYLRPTTTFAGDVSGTYGATSVDKIKGVGIDFSTAPTSGQVLKFNGTNWAPAADGGGSSSDASYSAKGVVQINTDQATSGLYIASGVLALPNLVTAGSVGSASSVPVLTYDTKGRLTAISSATVDDTTKLATSAYTTDLAGITGANVCTGDEKPYWNTISDTWDCTAITGFVTSSTGFVQNGNSFGTAATIGTNDAQPFNFETNSTTKMTILSNGSVGIGTTAPDTLLHIAGQIKITGGSPGAGKVLTSDAAGLATWEVLGPAAPANTQPIYSVRAATTANITLSGTQTVDDISLSVGDRVLVKNQTTASQNGVYVVSAGPWTRATDMDTWTEVVGYRVHVNEGSTWNQFDFVSTGLVSGVLGSTNVDWRASGSHTTATAFGVGALNNMTTSAGYATAFGSNALSKNTTGDQNTAVGGLALRDNTTGFWNTAVGAAAMFNNTSGNFNSAFGRSAMSANTTGSQNAAFGTSALSANTVGVSNSAFGMYSLQNSTTGNENTAIGTMTLNSNTTGANNLALGAIAMRFNTIGNLNVSVGSYALYTNVGKSESTAVGAGSMRYADDSATSAVAYNTALGAYSLEGSTTSSANTGIKNTALGHSSLKGMTSGSGNIGVGWSSGSAITTGSNNVVIGSNNGSTIATTSGNILIADGAGNIRIQADSTGLVTIPGTLKIAGGTPGVGKVLTSDAAGVASWSTISGSESTAVSNIGAAGVGVYKQMSGSTIELKKINAATSAITVTDDTANNELDIGVNAELAGLSGLSANGFVKRTGAGTFSSVTGLDLTADVTGVLPVANGGTGANTLGSGNLLVGAGTGAVTSLAAGTAGNVVYATGASTWASGTADTAGLVDKTSAQLISGAKTFSATVKMSNQNLLTLGDTGSNGISFRAPSSVGTSYTLTWPTGQGGASTVLTNDGSGNLSWGSAGGSPANTLPTYQVRAATNANITLSAPQTIDGISVVAGDRVLVKNQTSPEQNGVYVVAAGSWTRATDMDTWAEAVGYRATAKEGTNYAGMTFTSSAPNSGTLNTNSIYFSASGSTVSSETSILGQQAGNSLAGGSRITAIGISALKNNTMGVQNVAVGDYASTGNIDGYNNVAVGSWALMVNQSGYANTAVGQQALQNNTVNDNTAIGMSALRLNSTGTYNTAAGSMALSNNTTASSNSAFGYRALGATTAGSNSAFGASASQQNTTGTDNSSFGANALANTTTGSYNVAIGSVALASNQARSENVAVGYSSMSKAENSTTAATSYNTALGAYSLQGSAAYSSNTGTKNTALGHSALKGMSSGSNNIGIGWSAGSAITTGSNNVVIGSNDGTSIATTSGNIIISDGAGNARITADNTGLVTIPGTIKIAGGSPGAGKFLQSAADGTASWVTPSASSGTVTSVTSANSYLSVATTTSTPVITANVGTAANTLAAGDDSRIVNAVQQTAYNTDVTAASGCTTSQTVYWSTVSDTWLCQNIDITSATGFIKSGGNATGADITVGTNDNFGLNFETNNATQMTILPSGNVGFGETNPVFKFVTRTTASTANRTMFTSETGGTDIILETIGSAGGPSFSTQTAGPGWTKVNDYQIVGDFAANAHDGTALRPAAEIRMQIEGSVSSGNLPASMSFHTNSGSTATTEKMRISAGGNVGIGTNNPQTTLDVAGKVSVNSSIESISAYVDATTGYVIPDTAVNIRRLSLTANTLITLPAFNAPTAKMYTLTLFLKQDASGSRAVTWAANGSDTIKWDSGVAPTITTTADKITIIQFTKPSDEAVWYGSMVWREN